MSTEAIVSKALENVPKAVAAGVVDMGTGMLLDVKTVDSHPQQVLDLLAAATRDLFEGDTITGIEKTFKKFAAMRTLTITSKRLWSRPRI